jgi:hypothetical protein
MLDALCLPPLTPLSPAFLSALDHELEFQPDGTVYAAYNTRFPVPQNPGPPRIKPLAMPGNKQPLADPANMFYSVDIPGVAHMVYLSNYIPYDTWGTESVQYKWLAADLAKVDRTVSFTHIICAWYATCI